MSLERVDADVAVCLQGSDAASDHGHLKDDSDNQKRCGKCLEGDALDGAHRGGAHGRQDEEQATWRAPETPDAAVGSVLCDFRQDRLHEVCACWIWRGRRCTEWLPLSMPRYKSSTLCLMHVLYVFLH